MKVLLWHGYLLSGSGSNVLTANVARAWRAAGHEVLILCQDPEAEDLDFVDAVVERDAGGRLSGLGSEGKPSDKGRCVVFRPDIGSLLPVYVWDAYPGFESKLFIDLTEDELTAYVDRNVADLVAAIEAFQPEAILVGHEVMGPVIARRSCEMTGHSYTVQLHGSGLEYAVKRQDRYRLHAAEGLGRASAVIGGSRYMIREASSTIGGWPGTSAVVNPGCDITLFAPVDRQPPDVPNVAFVGKLIAAKGVQDLLCALSLTRDRAINSTIVGYGGFERELHLLNEAFRTGDIEAARRVVQTAGEDNLGAIDRYLKDMSAEALRRFADISVRFTGRMEHGPLARFLPTVDVLVVPSIVPEAFGMVAAEAAACGVLPIVPSHSGIAEAGAAIEEVIERPGFLTYDATDPIPSLAAAIDRVLDLSFEERSEMGRRAAQLARSRWSWDVVGANLLAVASGQDAASG